MCKIWCESLIICLPNHPMLLFTSNYFFFYVVNQVSPFHLLTFGLIHCVCGQLLDPMGIHLLCCAHCGERLHLMMLFGMQLYPLQKMQGFTFCRSKPMFFHHLFFNPFVDESTLFYRWMVFAHWSMLSLLTPPEQIWYHKEFSLVVWLQEWLLRYQKDFIMAITQQT